MDEVYMLADELDSERQCGSQSVPEPHRGLHYHHAVVGGIPWPVPVVSVEVEAGVGSRRVPLADGG